MGAAHWVAQCVRWKTIRIRKETLSANGESYIAIKKSKTTDRRKTAV